MSRHRMGRSAHPAAVCCLESSPAAHIGQALNARFVSMSKLEPSIGFAAKDLHRRFAASHLGQQQGGREPREDAVARGVLGRQVDPARPPIEVAQQLHLRQSVMTAR